MKNSILIWVIGILFIVVGTCFGLYYNMDRKITCMQEQYTKISNKLTGIQKDIQWLIKKMP